MRYIGCQDGGRHQGSGGTSSFSPNAKLVIEEDKWFSSWETVVGSSFMLKSVVKNIHKRKSWREEERFLFETAEITL